MKIDICTIKRISKSTKHDRISWGADEAETGGRGEDGSKPRTRSDTGGVTEGRAVGSLPVISKSGFPFELTSNTRWPLDCNEDVMLYSFTRVESLRTNLFSRLFLETTVRKGNQQKMKTPRFPCHEGDQAVQEKGKGGGPVYYCLSPGRSREERSDSVERQVGWGLDTYKVHFVLSLNWRVVLTTPPVGV